MRRAGGHGADRVDLRCNVCARGWSVARSLRRVVTCGIQDACTHEACCAADETCWKHQRTRMELLRACVCRGR
eukprot:6028489-Pleurochrysis_carterae.AAC.1